MYRRVSVSSVPCCHAERLHVNHTGPVCFYEVLAPYYFQV
jgi:hypothetical protein